MRTSLKRVFCALLLLLLAALPLAAEKTWAGGWVSSGGENFRDGQNPWFVSNTRRVSYCIVRDAGGVSASEAELREGVSNAIDFWLKGFRTLRERYFGDQAPLPVVAAIGTQEFSEKPCDGTEELRFVFGWGALDAEQKRYLGDFRKYVGIAVRTAYDEERLKAKGFIFLASDRGSNGIGGELSNKVADPWRRTGLLLRVLAHELGHVFGLPHAESGLMMAAYPELILARDGAPSLSLPETLESPLLPKTSDSPCSLPAEARRLLSIGTVRGCELEQTFDHGILIKANGTQKVFPLLSYVSAPSALIEEWSGVSRSLEGEDRPFTVRSGPGFLEVRSLEQGRIRTVFRNQDACRLDACSR
ncbi:MAG: hypothetical protein NDJ89_07580 [Oligoflexia bacterium]|nr:hypothetical protein [Oligoflexia bacterium]